MDRDTSLKWAPVFRGTSIVLILLTFLTWLLPYFNYDADDFGIDTSKGPIRFVPQVPADKTYAILSAPEYSQYEKDYLVDKLTGSYKVTLLFDHEGLPELNIGNMSYADYLAQNVYSKDENAFMKFTETVIDAATGEPALDDEGKVKTTEKSIPFAISTADIPQYDTADGQGYEAYLKSNVLIGSNPKSGLLTFETTDVAKLESDVSDEEYLATYVLGPKITNADGSIKTDEDGNEMYYYKIPLRFIPKDFDLYQGKIGMTYAEFLQQYVYDENANNGEGAYLVDMKNVGTLYRSSDTLKTKDGKNEIHDYPNEFTLWQFILQAYNYPQIMAQMNYYTAKQGVEFYRPYMKLTAEETEGLSRQQITERLDNKAKQIQASYHNRFYKEDGTARDWRTIKTANMDHDLINIHPRFIKMWFIAPTLLQILFGIVGLFMCWKKRGIMTQFFPFLFGIIGIAGYMGNRVLGYCSYPSTRAIQIAACVLVLANAIIGIVIQALEIKSRPDEYYLPMI